MVIHYFVRNLGVDDRLAPVESTRNKLLAGLCELVLVASIGHELCSQLYWYYSSQNIVEKDFDFAMKS